MVTRIELLKLIANQLDFLNGKFNGVRSRFTKEELKKANVILTTLEEAGVQLPKAPPMIQASVTEWSE